MPSLYTHTRGTRRTPRTYRARRGYAITRGAQPLVLGREEEEKEEETRISTLGLIRRRSAGRYYNPTGDTNPDSAGCTTTRRVHAIPSDIVREELSLRSRAVIK